jgi:hypothetical protein
MGKGLLQQIEEERETYSKLTKESFEGFLKELTPNPAPKPLVMFTGITGMVIFDLSLQGVDTSIHYNTLVVPNKGKYRVVFNIGRKEGLYKVYVEYGKEEWLVLKKGTEVICTCDSADSINRKLSELGLIDLERYD